MGNEARQGQRHQLLLLYLSLPELVERLGRVRNVAEGWN